MAASPEDNPIGAMPDPDQEVCVCFHVSRRKIENFIRLEQPRRAAQLAECFGAGTGCGWCRPWLVELFEASSSGASVELPDPAQYGELRREYHRQTGFKPS
jgi:NAD(P)H-nitrite reductase large subunit